MSEVDHLFGGGYTLIEEGYQVEKDEMRSGLIAGRTLIQEEWCTDEEKKMADELVIEGICVASSWKYSDNFQCERRYIKGVSNAKQTEAA